MKPAGRNADTKIEKKGRSGNGKLIFFDLKMNYRIMGIRYENDEKNKIDVWKQCVRGYARCLSGIMRKDCSELGNVVRPRCGRCPLGNRMSVRNKYSPQSFQIKRIRPQEFLPYADP